MEIKESKDQLDQWDLKVTMEPEDQRDTLAQQDQAVFKDQ